MVSPRAQPPQFANKTRWTHGPFIPLTMAPAFRILKLFSSGTERVPVPPGATTGHAHQPRACTTGSGIIEDEWLSIIDLTGFWASIRVSVLVQRTTNPPHSQCTRRALSRNGMLGRANRSERLGRVKRNHSTPGDRQSFSTTRARAFGSSPQNWTVWPGRAHSPA